MSLTDPENGSDPQLQSRELAQRMAPEADHGDAGGDHVGQDSDLGQHHGNEQSDSSHQSIPYTTTTTPIAALGPFRPPGTTLTEESAAQPPQAQQPPSIPEDDQNHEIELHVGTPNSIGHTSNFVAFRLRANTTIDALRTLIQEEHLLRPPQSRQILRHGDQVLSHGDITLREALRITDEDIRRRIPQQIYLTISPTPPDLAPPPMYTSHAHPVPAPQTEPERSDQLALPPELLRAFDELPIDIRPIMIRTIEAPAQDQENHCHIHHHVDFSHVLAVALPFAVTAVMMAWMNWRR
ncbi:hypothetical protein PMZ80_005066 [Knufia obscura]|uniref:Ubiquitin-like domain-containing protein n=1 Tax=Knufia obscura TaxID=1635080 RepID=A0ABR0RPI7_9EURO|nr:hypothetical protein PMZ80_005066 [Knufia obscura]